MKAVFGLLILVAVGCSSNEPKELPPGVCEVNKHCPAGERCNDGKCQDIYYPRHEIKNY